MACLLNYLFCVYNVIVQNLLGIKKPGNWQGLSNFSTWTFFFSKEVEWHSKVFGNTSSTQQSNHQNNNQDNENENIHSSQESTTIQILSALSYSLERPRDGQSCKIGKITEGMHYIPSILVLSDVSLFAYFSCYGSMWYAVVYETFL